MLADNACGTSFVAVSYCVLQPFFVTNAYGHLSHWNSKESDKKRLEDEEEEEEKRDEKAEEEE